MYKHTHTHMHILYIPSDGPQRTPCGAEGPQASPAPVALQHRERVARGLF